MSLSLRGLDRSRVGVAVVLVNWRAAAMTLRAVDHARTQDRPPDHIFVIDNGSGDGAAETLAAALSGDARATLIVNPENRGFGGGCNPGIAAAIAQGHRHIWLLNNDALPEPNCLAELLAVARAHDGPVGAVGSLLRDPGNRHAPHFGSWMHPLAMSCGAVKGIGDLRHPYSWCTAASLLLDAAAIEDVGAFDEEFFMYWEDADLNLRLRDAGYALLCAPGARVSHDAGTSSVDVPVQRYLWHFRSQRRFVTKHHRTPALARRWLRTKYLLKALYDRDAPRFRALLRET